MDIPSIEIPTNIQRVIKFLINRQDMVNFISDCFPCTLPEAASSHHPNIIPRMVTSILSNEGLKMELERCLEKCRNELDAYYDFSVKLKQNLSEIKERLSSELDIAYRNYKDIAKLLNLASFEHLMLEYIVLLEKLLAYVSLGNHRIEYPLWNQVENSKQFDFCKITSDEEKRLNSEFLTSYRDLFFEINDSDRRFIGNFLSTLEVLPNIVAGRRLKHWEIYKITNKPIEKPISLKDFLKSFCGIEKSDRLRAISQRINQAKTRKQIKLPKPVNVETKGSIMIFYYTPNDLIKRWKGIGEKLNYLPELI